MNAPDSPAWVHRFAVAALIVTIALTVGIGGTITSTEVGMAYPTWPDINGGSLFSFFYGELADRYGLGSVVEHTHRQAGSLTGLLVLATALGAWLSQRADRTLRLLATFALVLTVGQGLLGADRVLSNSYLGAILHAVGAQVVVVALVAVVLRSSPAWHEPPGALPADALGFLRRWTTLGMALLFLNLFAAASVRQKQGAFAGHLVLALATATTWFVLVVKLRRLAVPSRLRRRATTLLHLLSAQVLLGVGAWAVLLGPLGGSGDDRTRFLVQAVVATTHLLVGVLVMAAAAAVWIEVRHRLRPDAS